jgi:tetratricopeptide (TPR) repeat protein
LTKDNASDNAIVLLLGQVLTSKANYLAGLGRTEEAQECFEKALKIDDRDYFALIGMGEILVLNVTDETKAKALLSDKWIMDHTPKPHVDFVNTKAGIEAVKNGFLDMFQTNLEESLEYYDRAIKVNDEETLAWINKGLAAAMLGVKLVRERSLEAKECFVKAQELVNLHKKKDWGYDIKQLIKKIEKQIAKQIEEDMQTSIEEHEEEMEQEKLREEQDNYENRKKFGL